jgi:predicted transposase YbfD/YdcC
LKKTKNVEVILQVKGNQRNLLKRCEDIVRIKRPFSKRIQIGKRERNRIEERMVSVFHKGKDNLGDTWNDHIRVIIKVERKTKTFDTKTKQFETSGEIAFYIATTDLFSAKEFGRIIRSHWGIENRNHYVRDVSMHEDFSRIRKNPENIATLRSFALNLMRLNNESNISQTLYRNALNIKRILNYKGVGR